MKSLKFIILFIFTSFGAYGQGFADKVLYKITYAMDYFTFFGQKDVMTLDIGERSSHFYSKLKKRQSEIIDSLNLQGSVSVREMQKLTADCSNGQSLHIYKGIPESGKLIFTEEVTPDDVYRYDEDKPDMAEWNMLEADTVISGYRCQKAEGELRGRKWTMWFTPDIPIADGPWKFCGLPGLILKATEAEGRFAFCCIGLERGSGSEIKFADRKYIKCTPQQYQKMYYERTSDPVGYMKRHSGVDLSEYAVRAYGADAVKKKDVSLIEYYEDKPQK